MIFIDANNAVIEDVLKSQLTVDKKAKSFKKFPPKDIHTHEFDQTEYRIVTKGAKRELLTISIKLPHVEKVAQKMGLEKYLKTVYKSLLIPTEDGMTATVQIDCMKEWKTKMTRLIGDVSKLKTHCYAPVFFKAFDAYLKTGKFNPVVIPYRAMETIYILKNEKVFSVVFSIRFNDDDDVVLGKSFLQELKDAKKSDRSLSNAPAVTFTYGAKPVIMKNVKGVREKGNLKDYCFVVFSLFERHLKKENRLETIQKLLVFRNYLHYHLKCSKAYMHMRMRNRVKTLLQSLEAAKDMSGIVREKRDTKGKYLNKKLRSGGFN